MIEPLKGYVELLQMKNKINEIIEFVNKGKVTQKIELDFFYGDEAPEPSPWDILFDQSREVIKSNFFKEDDYIVNHIVEYTGQAELVDQQIQIQEANKLLQVPIK